MAAALRVKAMSGSGSAQWQSAYEEEVKNVCLLNQESFSVEISR